ncbi:hypothetical protein U5801_25575 [Lamprobacter modestohalophilus]|uniref:hypothetical protein n=1 Tax=Lamprobacter modestohalophilus TaxID=1064514 RepID=UPI002ADEC8CC|nr:hypothetical protein [Lamprobacter modestohalophilus]MEA1053151.1 hypothetical protein [Lamprobacter modestohalophilus]
MQPHWTLNLKTGLKVNVPADLDNPVTLTLLELEDWPEPECAFCCQLAQPGLRLLDADTGYGLFALSLAQALQGQGQGQGRVLALNPDPLFARSVADNGLQAVIHTEAETQAHSDHRQPAAAFDLIRLGATTQLDPSWLQQADPLFMLPSDSAALADLQAAGLSLYRLIPALNALVALQEAPDANGPRHENPERHANVDANGNTEADANGETEPSAQSALEKPAILFACHATRAAWLREQGRLIETD